MITVKPLEWSKYDEAVGFDCRYTVYQGGDGWTCVKYPHGDSHYRLAEGVSEVKARAAAFADYSARIMSAIEPAGVGVETAVRKHLEWFERFICDENELNSSTPRKVARNAQDAAAELRAALTTEGMDNA